MVLGISKGKGSKEKKFQEGSTKGIYPKTGIATGLQCSKFLKDFKLWAYCPLIYKISAAPTQIHLNKTLEFILSRCQRLYSSLGVLRSSGLYLTQSNTPSAAENQNYERGSHQQEPGGTKKPRRTANHSKHAQAAPGLFIMDIPASTLLFSQTLSRSSPEMVQRKNFFLHEQMANCLDGQLVFSTSSHKFKEKNYKVTSKQLLSSYSHANVCMCKQKKNTHNKKFK